MVELSNNVQNFRSLSKVINNIFAATKLVTNSYIFHSYYFYNKILIMNTHSVSCILILIMLAASACNQKPDSGDADETRAKTSEIKGVLDAGAGERVVLEEMGAMEYIPVDTVLCNDAGTFTMSFTQDQLTFYVLRYGSSGYNTLLMEPGESVEFRGKLEEKNAYSVSGSPGSELLRILAAEHKKTLDALAGISRKNREYVSSPDYTELKKQLDLQFDSITSAFQDYSVRFIHENAPSPAILIALYNLYGQGFPVFHPREDFPVYRFVDSVLMAAHNELEAVRLLHAQVTEAEEALSGNHQVSWLKKGEIAPDFVSSRPDGEEMSLSSLRGNYVLLSFWASWSKLCREENTTLVQARERFGKLNFRILQVSVDDDRQSWTGSIAEDRLDWDHVSDLKRWESPVVDLYGVEKIPFNVLIDPAGRILETEVYGEQLLSTLDQLLNN